MRQGYFYINRLRITAGALCVLLLALGSGGSGCLPQSPAGEQGGVQLTVYGFSIMKESLEKAIYPAFAAKWKQEHGQEVKFVSSFAGSETITNQILQGVGADIAILSIERDADRLKQLTNGVIEEIHFVGAYERLMLRLDLVARQPATAGEPPLYNVTINSPEERLGIPVVVTRPKPEAAATRFYVGDRVAVGLTAFRVLANFALASERGGKIVDA